MKIKMNCMLALGILVFCCLCCLSKAEKFPTDAERQRFQMGQRRFAGAMYSKLLQKHDASVNVFYSPTSIYHAMGMVLAGAKGRTAKQLMTTMRQNFTQEKMNWLFGTGYFEKFYPSESPVLTQMASKIFVMTNFSMYKNYTEVLKNFYYTEADNINFEMNELAAEEINDWVENKTDGLISDIVSPDMFDGLTRFALVNSLYFKAPWAKGFYETGNLNFSTPTGQVSAPFIRSTNNFKIKDGKHNLFVAIPYKDGETWMLILMPKNDQGMTRLSGRLKIETMTRNLNNRFAKAEFARLDLRMPEFSVEYSINVKEILKKMYVRNLFSPVTADLSGMSKEYLYVTDFVHKAKITVDKDGTEAAAATAVIGGARALFVPEDVFINRPFIYAIYKDGEILFMGRMADPSVK